MNGLQVDDALWERIEPLLPVPQRRYRSPGRQRLDDRACLNGILFVLATGIRWNMLPQQLGYGSGMTCWRRLRDWKASGTWTRLLPILLAGLEDADKIDWSRVQEPTGHAQRYRRLRRVTATAGHGQKLTP
jgi:transposase